MKNELLLDSDLSYEHVKRHRVDSRRGTVSADATPGQVRRLLAAGATAYLTKPIDVRDLLHVLDVA